MANLKFKCSDEDIQALSEEILEGVDYDIFKEDLESREILDYIEFKIRDFLENVETTFNTEEI